MNNFLDIATKRYSVRSYLPEPVEDEKLMYILECGRIAPSAANFQPWHIIVIKDNANRDALKEVYPRPWFGQAPVILALCGDHSVSWKRADGKDHLDIDIAILADHLTLAAAEQGLGTCWICNFDAAKCSTLLALPKHIEPVVLMTLGYPGKDPESRSKNKSRKTFNEILHSEKF